MVRRSAFYYFGQYIGTLSSGGIQSAVYSSMNGRNGLAGWRWNFIIDAIISVIVGIIGFYALPGDPYNCYSIFLTDDEIRLARKRLKKAILMETTSIKKLLVGRYGSVLFLIGKSGFFRYGIYFVGVTVTLVQVVTSYG